MAAPSAIVATCENCGEVVHRVLKGRITGKKELVFEGVVKCPKCGKVSNLVVREPKSITIPVVVSWMAESEKLRIEMEPNRVLEVGETFELGGGKAELTAIESEGRRVPAARAEDVETLWAKRVDQVRVKVTFSKGGRARSRDVFTNPDAEICIGDLLEIGKDKAIVDRIKVAERVMYRGCAKATEIKRLYARAARARESY